MPIGVIERKVLGAMLLLSDANRNVTASQKEIALSMEYVGGGGAISFSLRLLEMNNYITKVAKGKYKVLL